MSASHFQTGIFAINAWLGESIRLGVKNAQSVILSDSQAAIEALGTHSVSSALVKERLCNLNALTKHNQVVIAWVTGHKGVPGNEVADKLYHLAPPGS